MEKSIVFLLVLLSIDLTAQTLVERKIPADNVKQVSVDFPYGHVYVRALITIDNGRHDQYFELDVKKRLNRLNLKTSYGPLFKSDRKLFGFFKSNNKGTIIKLNTEEDQNGIDIDGILINTVYVLYLPQNVNLALKSISANVMVSSLDGDLVVNVTSGDILVKDHDGDVTLETVSGSIDIKIGKAKNLNAKTTIGRIFKKEQIPKLIIGEKLVGSFAKGSFDDGDQLISIATVSGDIHLRN